MVPFRLVFLPEIPSTSDEGARRVAAGELSPPAVVTTALQTAGRGTRGRMWHSVPGSLAATFVMPIRWDRPIHHVPLLAGLAVRKGLSSFAPGEEMKIKWPNDILLAGRKVAGLLCERKHGVDLVGIGVNTSTGDLAPVTAQLDTVAGALLEVDRWTVLQALAREVHMALLSGSAVPWSQAIRQWAMHDALSGKVVVVQTPAGEIAGRIEGLDEEGRLLLAEGSRVHAIASGTVRLAEALTDGT